MKDVMSVLSGIIIGICVVLTFFMILDGVFSYMRLTSSCDAYSKHQYDKGTVPIKCYEEYKK